MLGTYSRFVFRLPAANANQMEWNIWQNTKVEPKVLNTTFMRRDEGVGLLNLL